MTLALRPLLVGSPARTTNWIRKRGSMLLVAAAMLSLVGPTAASACGDFCGTLPTADTTCYSCKLAVDELNQPGSDVQGSGDADGDGLTDGYEWEVSATDAYNADSDGDSLTDGSEIHLTGTNPLDPDSEHDGMPDGCDREPWIYNTGDGAPGDLFGEGMGCSVSH